MEFNIDITKRALNRIRYLLEQEDDSNQGFRISIQSGGCSGLSYNLDFAKEPGEDIVINKDEVRIFIDPKYKNDLNGLKLDATLNGSFAFTNPNASGSCSCGTSFSLF